MPFLSAPINCPCRWDSSGGARGRTGTQLLSGSGMRWENLPRNPGPAPPPQPHKVGRGAASSPWSPAQSYCFSTPFSLRIDTFSFDFGLPQLVSSSSHWLWMRAFILGNRMPTWHDDHSLTWVTESTRDIQFRQCFYHWRNPMPLSNTNETRRKSDYQSWWNSSKFERYIIIKVQPPITNAQHWF